MNILDVDKKNITFYFHNLISSWAAPTFWPDGLISGLIKYTPSVLKYKSFQVCCAQTSLDLTKFIVKSINIFIYDITQVYFKNMLHGESKDTYLIYDKYL